MADKAHRLTDEKLEEMEKRLSAIYSRAEKIVQKKMADYAKSVDEKSAELLQAYKDAETEDEKQKAKKEYKQANGVLVRCTERKAQGILPIDGGTVYQLYEKEALENATMTAMVITTTEYLSLVDTLEDTELAAAKILLGGGVNDFAGTGLSRLSTSGWTTGSCPTLVYKGLRRYR